MQYKWVALTVTIVGTMMTGLDDRLLVVGLPTVAREIGASVTEAIWITQAFVVSSTIALLLIGRLADVTGRVRLYNLGFVLFTIGSFLAAISFTPTELIASRLVQGLGASALSANALAIITDSTPENELGTFIGFNQMAFRSGTIFGLILSGILLSITNWRALFYINIPVGIFGTFWAHYKLREVSTKDASGTRKVDWAGFATITCGLTLTLLGTTFFSYGASDYVSSSLVLVLGLGLIASFGLIERRKVLPLLDLKLLKIKPLAGGVIAAMFNAITWNGLLYMNSIFLQLVLGFSAFRAGLGLLPLEACVILVGPIAGRLSDRWKSKLLPSTGLVILAAACFYEGLMFTTSVSYPVVVGALLVIAIGQGIFNTPNTRAIMSSVPANRRGVSASLRQTFYNMGDSTGPILAITLITIGIPYAAFSALLQGTIGPIGIEMARQEFVSGYRLMALVLGAVSLISTIPFLFRAKKQNLQVPAN